MLVSSDLGRIRSPVVVIGSSPRAAWCTHVSTASVARSGVRSEGISIEFKDLYQTGDTGSGIAWPATMMRQERGFSHRPRARREGTLSNSGTGRSIAAHELFRSSHPTGDSCHWMVPSAGFEPATYPLGEGCSIP